MKHCIFIFWLLSFYIASLGQIQTIKQFVNYYSAKNGLPDNDITGIAQDSFNYLWIGTKQGLCYFDGNEFRQLKSKHKDVEVINSSDIHYTQIWRHKLFVTTANKTFVIDTKLKILDTSFNWLRNEFVCSMQHFENDVWIGSRRDLIKCDLNLKLKKKYRCIDEPQADKGIINIHVINAKQLLLHSYLNTFYDFDIRSEKTSRNKRLPYQPVSGYTPLGSHYDASHKALYVSVWGYGSFVSSINKINDTSLISNKQILANWFYNGKSINGKSFFCCDNSIFVADEKTKGVNNLQFFNLDNKTIEINKFNSIYKDCAKNIWIATSNGLLKYNDQQDAVKNISKSLDLYTAKNDIYDFHLLQDSLLFVAAYGKGLIKLNIDKQIAQSYLLKDMPAIWTISMLESEKKMRLAGYKKYVMDFDLKTHAISEVNTVIQYLDSANLFTFFYQDKNGRDWYSINNKGGILMYDTKKNKFHRFKKNDGTKTFTLSYANKVVEDTSGNLWFSTNKNNKFIEFNNTKNCFVEHEMLDEEGKPMIYHGLNNIIVDQQQQLLICGDGDGLINYNPKTKKSKIINTTHGLASNFVLTCVLDQRNRIWVGTSKGLSCIILNDQDFTIRNFGLEDGFIETEFGLKSVYNPKKNMISIATLHHIFQFNPDTLLSISQTNTTPIIEQIFVNEQSALESGMDLKMLDYKQNAISIVLGAVDFVSGQYLQFQVKLSGKDTNWIDLQKSRSINYTNLKPNDYTIFARVKQIGGEWSYLKMPATFTIVAPFWQRWWFIALSIVWIFIGIVLLIRGYFKRETKIEIQKLKQERAIEDERARIAADMHDDLGSGLMQIKYMAEDMIESTNMSKGEDLKKLGLKANELTESMGEIIWSMRDRNNTLEDLIYYMRSQFLQYADDNHLICQFELAETLPNTIISGGARRHIYLICKECLHNVVKHAKATRVTFIISAGKKLAIQIKDNGKGFNVKENFNGNGIVNLKKRAVIMNGELNFTSNKFGTVVDLTLDLEKIQINLK